MSRNVHVWALTEKKDRHIAPSRSYQYGESDPMDEKQFPSSQLPDRTRRVLIQKIVARRADDTKRRQWTSQPTSASPFKTNAVFVSLAASYLPMLTSSMNQPAPLLGSPSSPVRNSNSMMNGRAGSKFGSRKLTSVQSAVLPSSPPV